MSMFRPSCTRASATNDARDIGICSVSTALWSHHTLCTVFFPSRVQRDLYRIITQTLNHDEMRTKNEFDIIFDEWWMMNLISDIFCFLLLVCCCCFYILYNIDLLYTIPYSTYSTNGIIYIICCSMCNRSTEALVPVARSVSTLYSQSSLVDGRSPVVI